MTVCKHELRQGKTALIIWTAGIAGMMAMCILIFPEMASEMGTVTKLFANMGAFTAAFGMDKLNFGEFIGFFCIECGNILGLCGGFFAAMTGANALSKEERNHTAEFLFTQPVSRLRVIGEKLLSVVLQIVIMNIIVILTTLICMQIIGAQAPMRTMTLLFLAYFLLQIEIACITFGLSALLKHNSLGIGLGIAAVLYFLNLGSNLTKKLTFLRYITPYGYAEGSKIVGDGVIPMNYLLTGCLLSILGIAVAFRIYSRKDLS